MDLAVALQTAGADDHAIGCSARTPGVAGAVTRSAQPGQPELEHALAGRSVGIVAVEAVLAGRRVLPEEGAALVRVAAETIVPHRDARDQLLRHCAGGVVTPPKGEIVVLVGPPDDMPPAPEDIDAPLIELLTSRPVRQAAAEVAAQTGLGRRGLYQRALALKKEVDDGAA